MVKLSEEMKKMIGERLPFLSTASEFGLPQIGPKGSLHVFENDNLVYYEHTFKQAYENIKQNGHVAAAVVPEYFSLNIISAPKFFNASFCSLND